MSQDFIQRITAKWPMKSSYIILLCFQEGWSEWSPCSRTCDGGTSFQIRKCAHCLGPSVKYRICNMQVYLKLMIFLSFTFFMEILYIYSCTYNAGVFSLVRVREEIVSGFLLNLFGNSAWNVFSLFLGCNYLPNNMNFILLGR